MQPGHEDGAAEDGESRAPSPPPRRRIFKIAGVRAALCYDKASARHSREHNDANVLTLGGRLIAFDLAAEVVALWLFTPFAGGRHAARVEKIKALDSRG